MGKQEEEFWRRLLELTESQNDLIQMYHNELLMLNQSSQGDSSYWLTGLIAFVGGMILFGIFALGLRLR
jgi:hypothetical protein